MEKTMMTLLLKNVRPMGKDAVDVLVDAGKIRKIQANITPPADAHILDGHNHLLLPGLVNAHAHIDKNLFGLPWLPNQVPEPRRIIDYVNNEQRILKELNLSTEVQASHEIRQSIACGTTHIRTHVDIGTAFGLPHFEGVLAAKDTFKEEVTMQTVAFPQSGMLIRHGTVELLEEAVKMGADCIGGLDPSTVDRDPTKHLDIVFDIANRYGVEVDIHLHEPGMLGAFAVELIAERTAALGLQGKVTISHVFCLGMIEDAYLDKLIQLLLDNQITIMSLASGRSDFPPLKKLADAGVALCTGTDGVRDSWGIYNSVDMFDRVRLLGYRCGLRKDEDVEWLLDIALQGGATVMKDADYGLAVGKQADFVVVAGDTLTEAVITQAPRTYVVKNGRVVASNGEYQGKH
jgi:cytosine/adenosine deaminase-related metal-dependent hydrolase